MRIALTVILVLTTFSSLQADLTDVRITEVWTGLSGGRPDGSHDWIEITNLGDTSIETSELLYDDEDPDPDNFNQLQSLTLEPGESAIFLLDVIGDNPMFDTAIGEFLSVWTAVDPFLVANAGEASKLGANGDAANLLTADGVLFDSFQYSAGNADTFMTIERTGPGFTDVRRSVFGENGAIESEMYFDEDTNQIAVDENGAPIILIGSPGVFMMDVLGDVNCDCAVNLLDVGPFVDAISSGVFDPKADINGDGSVDLLDVGEFVALLSG